MDELKETANPTLPEVSSESQPATAPAPVSTPPPKPQADAPSAEPWDRVRQVALKQLDRFLSLEPKVLKGEDPDAIHDIRVASRRLQQVLDLLYPRPRPGEIRRLRRKIRRCRRALGEVRNCDVLLAHVDQKLARKRTANREAWTALDHYLRQRRSSSFEQAVRKLSKVNLAVFYVHLKDWVTSDGASSGLSAGWRTGRHLPSPVSLLSEVPAREPFSARVGRELERVWQALEAQVAHSHQDPRTPVIHGVRIAAKRVRYLIEVLHALEMQGSGDTVAWFRQLQQHLGNWHDLEILEQMTIEMIARPGFLREHLDLALKAEKLVLKVRGTKKQFEEKYVGMTKDSEEFSRVKEWVGYVLGSPSEALAMG